MSKLNFKKLESFPDQNHIGNIIETIVFYGKKGQIILYCYINEKDKTVFIYDTLEELFQHKYWGDEDVMYFEDFTNLENYKNVDVFTKWINETFSHLI